MSAVFRATNVQAQTVIVLFSGKLRGDLTIIWRVPAASGIRLWAISGLHG